MKFQEAEEVEVVDVVEEVVVAFGEVAEVVEEVEEEVEEDEVSGVVVEVLEVMATAFRTRIEEKVNVWNRLATQILFVIHLRKLLSSRRNCIENLVDTHFISSCRSWKMKRKQRIVKYFGTV